MKKFGVLVLSAVLGSALTIGAFRFIGPAGSKTIRIEHISDTPVVGAAYTVNREGEIIPLEFTGVAEKVMPAVVHIKSTQIRSVRQYRSYPDPFRHFFDDEMICSGGFSDRNSGLKPRNPGSRNRRPVWEPVPV